MSIIKIISKVLSQLEKEGDYLYESEKWFDDFWNKLRDTYCGDGIIYEEKGMLYRKFNVTFNDGISGTFLEEKDKCINIENVKLENYQKKELERKKYFILKHYNG